LKNGIINTNIILFGIIWPLVLSSQNTDCSNSTTYVNQVLLEINLNGGITSYFGDLSMYDKAPIEKIAYESLPGFGIIANLQLTKTYSISGQILMANVKAGKDTVSFQSRIFEYNIHGRIDLLNFFRIAHNPNFGIEVYAGIGQFFYSVDKETRHSHNTDNTRYTATIPEFVYFLGGGLSYRTSKYTTLTLDLALRQCQTDRLDDFVKHSDFDYYSYLSMGITIDVGRLINPYLKSRFRLK
jgi:hypothetical protein